MFVHGTIKSGIIREALLDSDITEMVGASLAKAGLPPERECIGRSFAFTWTDVKGQVHRLTSQILGLHFDNIETGEGGVLSFAITTAPLFRSARLSFGGGNWYIGLTDLLGYETGFRAGIYTGELEIL